MLLKPEVLHEKAEELVREYRTRDALRIARMIGIYVSYRDNFGELPGLYTRMNGERHIILNSRMEPVVMQMTCAHEIGHDCFHRELIDTCDFFSEYSRSRLCDEAEYEANAFAAHLLIDDGELDEALNGGADNIVSLAAALNVSVSLMLIKLHEAERMGRRIRLPHLPRADFMGRVARRR